MADPGDDGSAVGSQTSGGRRYCVCGKLMPRIDLHEACDLCRGTLCSFNERCAICSTWSDEYFTTYLSHMEHLVRRREQKRKAKMSKQEASSDDFCGFASTPTTSAAPVVTLATSASTSTAVVSSPRKPITSSKVSGGIVGVSQDLQETVRPEDSVSVSSSRMARLMSQSIAELSKVQRASQEAFEIRMMESITSKLESFRQPVTTSVSVTTNSDSVSAPPKLIGRPGTSVTCGDPSPLMPPTTSATFVARREADGEDPVAKGASLPSRTRQEPGAAPVPAMEDALLKLVNCGAMGGWGSGPC